MSRAPEARETLVEALAAATAELHELRTENMRLRHQARETAAIHDRLAAELVTVQASTDRLLAQCVRQRALLDDLRAAPIEHVAGSYIPQHYRTVRHAWQAWRLPVPPRPHRAPARRAQRRKRCSMNPIGAAAPSPVLEDQ